MKFDKQGHRGCRGLMPENTIQGFIRAIELGVTTLEMDTVITLDKKVLVSHEPYFSHEITTQSDGGFINKSEEKQYNIYKMNYEQTQQFDVGLKVHPRFPHQKKIKAQKPLLSEVIDTVELYTKQHQLTPLYYNIETKCLPEFDYLYNPSPEEFTELLVSIIGSKHITNRVIIQSFDIRTLQYLTKHYPEIKTSLLIEADTGLGVEEQIQQLGFVPNVYSPDYAVVTDSVIETCKKINMEIIPWTVNDLSLMQKLKNMGVNGVISDFPNLFNELE